MELMEGMEGTEALI